MIQPQEEIYIPQLGRSSSTAPESHPDSKSDCPSESGGGGEGKPATKLKTFSVQYVQHETGWPRAMSLDASLDWMER